MGRSQRGNNNAYCHDSPLTWTPWDLDASGVAFLAFVRSATALRATHPALGRRGFLEGRLGECADVLWLHPDGREMTTTDWANDALGTLGVLFDGRGSDCSDDDPADAPSEVLLLILNAASESVAFRLPALDAADGWRCLIDTAEAAPGPVNPTAPLTLLPYSALVLAATRTKTSRAFSGKTKTDRDAFSVAVDADPPHERSMVRPEVVAQCP